jgi:hypothetical protein
MSAQGHRSMAEQRAEERPSSSVPADRHALGDRLAADTS